MTASIGDGSLGGGPLHQPEAMAAAAAPQSDPFAFTDPKMEVAFVVYLARRSQLGCGFLCCARWLCCVAVIGRCLHSALRRYLLNGEGVTRDGAQSALLLAILAACTFEDVQLLRGLLGRQPQPLLAAHEARKSHGVLCHAMARMVACISVAALLAPLPAAPICAASSGAEVLASHLRLAVGLPLLALSCLCCCFTLASQALSGGGWADIAASAVATLVLGFLLPAAALAWQEVRCRCVFAGLHRPEAGHAMPPLWQAAAKHLCRWTHPAAETGPVPKNGKLQQAPVQLQPPAPAYMACSSKQPANRT